MTQTARKGKLYQLQVLIDLSCFIISHLLVLGCPHPFGSTKLIHFVIMSRKMKNLTVWSLIEVVAGGVGTIIVVLIMAPAWSEMGRLKTLNSYTLGTDSSSSQRSDPWHQFSVIVLPMLVPSSAAYHFYCFFCLCSCSSFSRSCRCSLCFSICSCSSFSRSCWRSFRCSSCSCSSFSRSC